MNAGVAMPASATKVRSRPRAGLSRIVRLSPKQRQPIAGRPPRLRGGLLANLWGQRGDSAPTLEHLNSRVDFAMAVGTRHHALEELCCDRLPPAAQAVPRVAHVDPPR